MREGCKAKSASEKTNRRQKKTMKVEERAKVGGGKVETCPKYPLIVDTKRVV